MNWQMDYNKFHGFHNKFHKHKDFHFNIWEEDIVISWKTFHSHSCVWMGMSDEVYSKHFLFKLCYKLNKLEVFRLYVCGYGSYTHVSLKILYYKLNKHEAFGLYESDDASLGHFSLKILRYKLHKHEAFHLHASEDGNSNFLF